MKRYLVAGIALLLAAATQAVAAGPQEQNTQKATVTSVLERRLSAVEHEVVPAAEAMPDDKYNFAPTQGEFKGVRTFALQVKHIATINYELFAPLAGEKPPVDMGENENGAASLQSKADIVKYLKDSFAYAHKCVQKLEGSDGLESIRNPFGEGMTTRLNLAILGVAHPYDHYGQMVEYLRMNGIIPPASRAQ